MQEYKNSIRAKTNQKLTSLDAPLEYCLVKDKSRLVKAILVKLIKGRGSVGSDNAILLVRIDQLKFQFFISTRHKYKYSIVWTWSVISPSFLTF